jgi:uncharacterized Tic20 family protein
MNDDQFKKFEKSFTMSKKFIAFFLTLLVLAGIDIFIIWKIADAGDISMWTATVLITDIVALSFVSMAFNVRQAALDSAVRLASILGDKFSLDKFKGMTGQ